MLLLSEEQAGETWKPSNKAMFCLVSGNPEQKVLSLR
jgi:hypothetical protein